MFWLELPSIVWDDALGIPNLHAMVFYKNLMMFLVVIVAKGSTSACLVK